METKLPFEKIEREILIKKDSKTCSNYGEFPEKRTIKRLLDFGIINIDKPKGPTSHQVSAYVQQILKIKKSGHSGTLDPIVTGVLPVAIGKGTKIVQLLLLSGKEYVALMHIHKPTEEYKIHQAAADFIGKIKQLPPIKSAVKRQWRERKVYYIDIIQVKGQDVLFKVGCEAGTYIRKLIHDWGQKIGCGANMQELRRTKVASFNESTICTLQELTDAFYYYNEEGKEEQLRKLIMPIERAIEHIPKIWIFDSTVETLCHGADLAIPGISKLESGIEPDQTVAIVTLKGELVSYGKSLMNSDKMLKSEKGLAVRTDKVFMEPGTYPKLEKKETVRDEF